MARTAGTFTKFKEKQLAGAASLNLATLNIKGTLIQLLTWGIAVTAATNASPSVVTCTAHGMANGDRVCIIGSLGNTAINGLFSVAGVTTNTFTLTDLDTAAAVAGNGVWTSGGRLIKLEVDQFLGDIPVGDRGAASANFTSKTYVRAAFDSADPVCSSVPAATYSAFVVYNDTGTVGTSDLLSIAMGGAGLPITVGSGSPTVNVTVDPTGHFIL